MAKAKPASEVAPPPGGIVLTFPALPPLDGAYVPTHLDLQLSPKQGEGLRRLFIGLDKAGNRLRDGRRITYFTDVVRALLEQAADAPPMS